MSKCAFCEKIAFLKGIQEPEMVEGCYIAYEYTVAIVDECLCNREPRGKTTHYTWLKFRYCPTCGKKLEK